MLYTKQQASILARKAVKIGLLAKAPCEVCGCVKSEGHHSDYSKPIEVMWLCRKHHMGWHSKNGVPEAKKNPFKMEEYLKDKRDEIILNLRNKGFSLKDICKIFKLDRSSVGRIIKLNDYK